MKKRVVSSSCPIQNSNVVSKILNRQIGFSPPKNFQSECFPLVFQNLSLQGVLTLHDTSNEKHKLLTPRLQKITKIIEILAADEILVVLEECGLCVAFNIGLYNFLF
jgi:hypothetical protein